MLPIFRLWMVKTWREAAYFLSLPSTLNGLITSLWSSRSLAAIRLTLESENDRRWRARALPLGLPFAAINTRNPNTDYRSGSLISVELTGTKTIGQWTLGPVAYYRAQVTDDTSSAFYGNAVNLNRYQKVALGGLVGYNFGAATLNVWALKEVAQRGHRIGHTWL
jgi:hypothetical protein